MSRRGRRVRATRGAGRGLGVRRSRGRSKRLRNYGASRGGIRL